MNPPSKLKLAAERRAWIPYFVLLASLLLTLVAAYFVAVTAEAKDQLRFQNSVQHTHNTIRNRLETHIALLHAGTGLFIASREVEPAEFRLFVAGLDLRKQYPGIQGIGFAARLRPEEREALVAKMRAEGLSDFRIWPEAERSEYYSIIFLEPLDQRNRAALGFDMFTEPVRREAMERARDTGRPAASGRVKLVQEIDEKNVQAGFLIYAPVYARGQTPETIAERREALRGFVYSPFRVDDLLAGIFLNEHHEGIDFQVYEGQETTPANLLHTSAPSGDSKIGPDRARFTARTTLDVAGRVWHLAFATRPEFDAGSGINLVPLTLLGGLLTSIILFFLTRAQARARAAAESAALELKQSQAAIKESEERYRELFENANDIFYTLDLQGQLTSLNKAGEQITGYRREEILGQNIASLISPETLGRMREMLDLKVIGGQQRTNYELEILAKDGRRITLEISSRLINQNGVAVGIQGTARDLTERKRAEEALHEADQRALTEYERLIERINLLAQALGTARDLQTIFRALRDFALASVPCVGLFISLYDPKRDARIAAFGWGDGIEFDVSDLPPMPITASGPNSRAVRTGESVITDDYMAATRGHPGVVVGPDNGLRPQSSLVVPMAVMSRIIGTIEVQSYGRADYRSEHATAMSMAANLVAVAIENARLLEHESRARAVAEESNRMKDEFLATVSHELRTPLTSILGWSNMLSTGMLDKKTVRVALETIERNAKAQAQIIDDILDASRIITGKLSLDVQPVELRQIIEAATNAVRPAASAKHIQIETNLDSGVTPVLGDASRLQQVVWNLLSNAVKFTPRTGRVRVSLKETQSGVEIKVKDTGQGISQEFLPFVFERFRQADSTTTRAHGGLGLGLAIVRHLIELHGGMVQAESDGADRGATFTVTLPLMNEQAAALLASARGADAPDGHELNGKSNMLEGVHVLIVDDDQDTLTVLKAILERRAMKVTAATSAHTAIEALEEAKPDVLVADIGMPEVDGYELIRRVRMLSAERGGKIPAVALTAYAREDDRRRSLEAGFQKHLSKPIEPAELVSAITLLTGPDENGSDGDESLGD